MIPQFPEFKKLELSDKKEVEKITLKYPPYSDFNFAGTWSWDVRDQMKISQLNGNYVIRFIDYLTGEPFYTFLGDKNVNDTAKKILDLSKEQGLEPELSMVPNNSIKGLDLTKFKLEEDRDHFDYIYDIKEQIECKGAKFSHKRNQISSFLKKYPDAGAKLLNLKDINVRNNIIELVHKWEQVKLTKNPDLELHKEEEIVVINKLCDTVDIFDIFCPAVFVGDKLEAFCINEYVNLDYVMVHVLKSDVSMPGINSFLMKKSAEFSSLRKKKYINYEQDLGLESLRTAKMRARPSFLLKKYKLTYY